MNTLKRGAFADEGCAIPGPFAQDADRPRIEALQSLFRAAATGFLLGSLVACGGGGGDAPPAPVPAPAPPPAPLPVPAQLSVPDPVGYDEDHLAAFNRLNELRLSAGLGMFAQD